MSHTPDPAIVAYVIADSDRADRELALRLEAWREGWRACQCHQGDRYEAGYHDGWMAFKRALHDLYRDVQRYAAGWGSPAGPRDGAA